MVAHARALGESGPRDCLGSGVEEAAQRQDEKMSIPLAGVLGPATLLSAARPADWNTAGLSFSAGRHDRLRRMHSHTAQRVIVWSALALLLIVALGSLTAGQTAHMRHLSHEAPVSTDRFGQSATVRFLASLPPTSARCAFSHANHLARDHEQALSATAPGCVAKPPAEVDSSFITSPLRI